MSIFFKKITNYFHLLARIKQLSIKQFFDKTKPLISFYQYPGLTRFIQATLIKIKGLRGRLEIRAGGEIKNLGYKFLVPFSRVAKNVMPISYTAIGRT